MAPSNICGAMVPPCGLQLQPSGSAHYQWKAVDLDPWAWEKGISGGQESQGISWGTVEALPMSGVKGASEAEAVEI